MSILIKGVKMPRCCEVCPCNDDNWRCGALGDTFDDLEIYNLELKPSCCPLVEVPEPHGRLIDGDKLEDTLSGLGDRAYRRTKGTIMDAQKFLNNAPTVIEAEEQDHDSSGMDNSNM